MWLDQLIRFTLVNWRWNVSGCPLICAVKVTGCVFVCVLARHHRAVIVASSRQ